jgi:hypothetical protein
VKSYKDWEKMSADYYHDDPEFIDNPKNSSRLGKLFASLIFLVCGGLFIQTTLASNISLNSSGRVEFGQAVTRTIACDSNGVTITASASFVNAQAGGSYALGSIKVSGIDSSSSGCQGEYLTIKAYGNTSSTPLQMVSGVTQVPVAVNSSNPIFSIDTIAGVTISGDSSSFTLQFDAGASPIASNSVFKFTLESSNSSPVQPLLYQIGDTGTGGGTIFYRSVAAFTATGAACGSNCHYLEFAPKGWASLSDWPNNVGSGGTIMSARANVNEDPYLVWSDGNFVSQNPGSISVGQNIGTGYQNTQQILNNTVTSGKSPRFSFVAALNYVGAAGASTAGQWFLPSIKELNELCKYARGQVGSLGDTSVECTKSGTTIDTNLGFNDADNIYLSSSYGIAPNGFIAGYKFIYGSDPLINSYYATWGGRVRPVRVF